MAEINVRKRGQKWEYRNDYLEYWFDNYCKINLRYNTQLGYLPVGNADLQEMDSSSS